MTCVTIMRLGQVSNRKRPSNELTAALKGRIVYLPVDVAANAKFLPENLFNLDSLVLLVGGQPTKQNKVWTSAVDLRKVHVALSWLREHNHFYKDVPSYSLSDIEKIVRERQQQGTNASDYPDKSLLKKLDDASKSHLYENFYVQPISGEFPADTLVDYQLNKLQGQNVDIFDSDLDLKAYPELYPTGENGMRDARRTVKIGTSEFIRNRLLNKDPKFRLNLNYLFHCFQTQEISNMCHTVGHMLRTVTGNNLTAKNFLERLQHRDGEVQSNLFSLMANMRGTKEYYAKLGMDIRWMIRKLGPPTLFVTCSIAEWFSEPLLNYIRNINSTVPGIDKMTPAELCALDPVSVSMHLKQKWDAIFKQLIQSKKKPLFGEVQDSVTRLEYQARGAGHIHCLLWIKDAPILGQNSVEEVKRYINSIITCEKPDRETSPTLYNLVTKFQSHKCNKYCTKTYKKNGKFFKKCRFGFPRPMKSEIQINDIIDCLATAKNNQPRKRVYHIARSKDETFINDYNPALLLANQANVDVQYIGHTGSRLPYYISDYITKSEKSEQDTMWQDIFSSTKSVGTNAMSFLLKSLRSRQVGAHEAADRLLGHKLYTKSRQMRFADLQPPHKAKRVLKNVSDINSLLKNNPESEDIFQPHWTLDVYPDRPDELENSSLYEILAWYEREINTGSSKETLKLKNINFHLRRRTKTAYIVTHQSVNPNLSEENKQTYYYFLLKLFKPWRSECELCIPGKNYYETFVEESNRIPDMLHYHNQNLYINNKAEQEEQAVRKRAEELQEEVENDAQPEDGQTAFEGCATDQIQTAMVELHELHRTKQTSDSENLQRKYDTLNADQKRVVDKVVSAVCVQQQQLLLFVSGQGGTGKSRVIDVLDRTVGSHSRNSLSVIVTAPTGLAAFNIHGVTIHRTLCLPVEHGKPADYNRLNQEQLSTIRATLRNVQLLIIDEVSMVSSLLLLYIHLRLTEIIGKNELFGGISVVFFADLLQLPPVKGNQPFMNVTSLEVKQRVGSIGHVNLWEHFQYDELTINMRQSGDREYADLLSAVRIGKLSDDHLSLLKQQLIAKNRRATLPEITDKYQELVHNGNAPVILMPKVALCQQLNKAMLNKLNHEIHALPAEDNIETIVSKTQLPKVQKEYNKISEDSTRTAGLEKRLELCVGAKVMLKRNRDVESGLVNGSLGTVIDFSIINRNSQPYVNSIAIQFNNLQSPVNIERESVSFEVLKSVYYTRRQFPVITAFAITVHKSQGLSLETAIVDAGPATFGPGMIYVGLSRVTMLSGLHLIDFDSKKLSCDMKAIKEYNRLRLLYTSHLGELLPLADDTAVDSTGMQNKPHTSRKRKKPNRFAKPVSNEQQNQQATHREIPEQNMFQFCQINSMNTELQNVLCTRFNLQLVTNEIIPHDHHLICKSLKSVIFSKTQQTAAVKIYRVKGDGNCLFGALSYSITGTQDQHSIIRSYIVNHMLHSNTQHNLEMLFATRNKLQSTNISYQNHLCDMQQDGTWGTEQEIVAAANLFDVSVLCYCKYNSKQYCIQHFSPHFAINAECTSSCNHKTVYLINKSGNHYNPAVVML